MNTATLPHRPAETVLLTVEEAQRRLLRSSLVCLWEARCPAEDLRHLLAGHVEAGELDRRHRRLARSQRSALQTIERAGYGWIIDDQLDGICSAVGLDDGEIGDIDVIAAQLPHDADDDDPDPVTAGGNGDGDVVAGRKRGGGTRSGVARSHAAHVLGPTRSRSVRTFAAKRIRPIPAVSALPAHSKKTDQRRRGGVAAKFEIRQTGNEFCWVLLSQGRVLATSEPYSRKASCVKAIESFRKAAAGAAIIETGKNPPAKATRRGPTRAEQAAPAPEADVASRVAAAAVESRGSEIVAPVERTAPPKARARRR